MTEYAVTAPRRRRRRGRVVAALVAAGLALLAYLLRDPLGELHASVRADAADGPVADVLRWGVVACLVYVVVVFTFYAVLMLFAGLDSAIRNRQRGVEDFDALEASRFTIPVSIISAVYNEAPVVARSTETLLRQQYPEYDVIVVDDGSTDGTFDRLQEAFALQQREVFFRRRYETRPIVGVYRSALHPRLTVVRKLNGGKADALNCGLNFARYRYVLGVDGDTLYRTDALLMGMRLVVRDPARVVAVTGMIAISDTPERLHEQEPGNRTVDKALLSVFQHLDYARAFLANRLAWSRLRFMLCTVGAFHIWRRDLLDEVGGFSRDFTCEDIEMTFRIHEKLLREGRDYEVLCIPETVATTEGPARVRALVKQRARWQRVIMETLVHYRRMLLNPRYRTVGLVGVPFYMVTEVAAPFFEALAILTLVLAIWVGVADPLLLALILGTMAFTTATLTSCAVLVDDRTRRDYRLASVVRSVLVGPLDLFFYRPVLFWARLRGTWDFLRGRRDWDKFERNRRAPAATAPLNLK